MALISFKWFLIVLSPSIDFSISRGGSNFWTVERVYSVDSVHSVHSLHPVNPVPIGMCWVSVSAALGGVYRV